MLSLLYHANILEMTVVPTQQPLVGRGSHYTTGLTLVLGATHDYFDFIHRIIYCIIHDYAQFVTSSLELFVRKKGHWQQCLVEVQSNKLYYNDNKSLIISQLECFPIRVLTYNK